MLRYFARGRVRWKNGMRCNTRTNWEFYAVIDGRCGLRFIDRQRPLLRERTLWVFAPECSHAWASPRGVDYERISMHFASVPYPLDDVVRANGGWLERPIGDADIARLRTIADELEPAFCHPTAVSPLICQRHLLDLSLLLLAGRAFAELPPALTDLANFKIERALSWYAEHLARNPTVKEVADAMHVSPQPPPPPLRANPPLEPEIRVPTRPSRKSQGADEPLHARARRSRPSLRLLEREPPLPRLPHPAALLAHHVAQETHRPLRPPASSRHESRARIQRASGGANHARLTAPRSRFRSEFLLAPPARRMNNFMRL